MYKADGLKHPWGDEGESRIDACTRLPVSLLGCLIPRGASRAPVGFMKVSLREPRLRERVSGQVALSGLVSVRGVLIMEGNSARRLCQPRNIRDQFIYRRQKRHSSSTRNYRVIILRAGDAAFHQYANEKCRFQNQFASLRYSTLITSISSPVGLDSQPYFLISSDRLTGAPKIYDSTDFNIKRASFFKEPYLFLLK